MVSVVCLSLLTIRLAPRLKTVPVEAPNGNQTLQGRLEGLPALLWRQVTKVLGDFREAFRLIRKSPPIRFVILSIGLMVMLGAAILVLLVPIIQSAHDDLGLGAGTRGVGFVGAAGSVGLVISSIAYGFVGRRLRKRNAILGGFAMLGVIGMLVGLSNSLSLILFLAFIAGLLLSPIYIAQDTILHETVPEEARGRVFSTREWFLNASFAVSALIIGQLTRIFPQNMTTPFGLAILADKRRLLFIAVCIVVSALSLLGFWATSKEPIS